MAIKRNSAGFISSFSSDADFKGKQLKVREILSYMNDGDTPTVCAGKNYGGEPDYDSITGDLDLGTLGYWHNVAVRYDKVSVGSSLPDWKLEPPYIIRYHASDDTTDIKYSYIKIKDSNTSGPAIIGWVDSRAVNII